MHTCATASAAAGRWVLAPAATVCGCWPLGLVDHIHDEAAGLEGGPLPALVVHGGEEDLGMGRGKQVRLGEMEARGKKNVSSARW